jgi:8-oxo-dGTP diphosphatase
MNTISDYMKEKKRVGAGFGVLVLNEGKILLGRRHEDPDKADSEFKSADEWTMPGGKLEWGETFEEGAKREVKEETDLDIELDDLDVLCVNNDMNEHAHFITIGLIANKVSGKPRVMEPDEITEWKFFDLNELPENFYFPSKNVLENYLEKKFYIKKS